MQNKRYVIPNWPAPSNVHAVSTTRIDGYSDAPFAGFNLSKSAGDTTTAVEQNRKQLQHDLKLPAAPVWLKQVHSNDVVHINDINDANNTPIADAAIASQPHRVCTVLTADCLPLLVCNRQATEIAAIHAGWRGLLSGVIQATIMQMHSAPADLMVWLGPAIGPEVFELNHEIRLDFVQANPQNSANFYQRGDSWFADIYGLAKVALQSCNVHAIYGGDYCTYTQAEQFFSYRRDQGNTGRMASLIWLTHE